MKQLLFTRVPWMLFWAVHRTALITLVATIGLSSCKKDEPDPDPKNAWKKAWYTLVDGANCQPLPGITFTCIAYKLSGEGGIGSSGSPYTVHSATEYTSDSNGRFFVDLSDAGDLVEANLQFGKEFFDGTHPTYFLYGSTYGPGLSSIYSGLWQGKIDFHKYAYYRINVIDHPDSLYKGIRLSSRGGIKGEYGSTLDINVYRDTSFIVRAFPSDFCADFDWESSNSLYRDYEVRYMKGGQVPYIRKFGKTPLVRGGDTAEFNIYY